MLAAAGEPAHDPLQLAAKEASRLGAADCVLCSYEVDICDLWLALCAYVPCHICALTAWHGCRLQVGPVMTACTSQPAMWTCICLPTSTACEARALIVSPHCKPQHLLDCPGSLCPAVCKSGKDMSHMTRQVIAPLVAHAGAAE